jgi:hypothetical protein
LRTSVEDQPSCPLYRDNAGHTEASKPARERYTAYYSTQRLRRLATWTRGDAHGDLYARLHGLTLASYSEMAEVMGIVGVMG